MQSPKGILEWRILDFVSLLSFWDLSKLGQVLLGQGVNVISIPKRSAPTRSLHPSRWWTEQRPLAGSMLAVSKFCFHAVMCPVEQTGHNFHGKCLWNGCMQAQLGWLPDEEVIINFPLYHSLPVSWGPDIVCLFIVGKNGNVRKGWKIFTVKTPASLVADNWNCFPRYSAF